jgi:putative ubiquitin-RnfH superfamily antitoxin RatB of RatAB toxin-antitoxin module
MRVLVAIALPGGQEVVALELAPGATIAQALALARVAERYPALGAADTGLWGRRCAPETKLREGDRVEVYRPLKADAKALRRARVRR